MKSPVKCKTLLGHKNLDFSIECLRTFVDNCSDEVHLQFFEDGTIDDSDKIKLLSNFKNSTIISKEDRDQKINYKLQEFPLSLSYRNNVIYAQKIFDVMLYENEDLLFIDSDVFFLKKFTLPCFGLTPVFMTDVENAYSFHPLDFLKINIPIFPRINTGFFYFPKEIFNLPFIEGLLSDEVIKKGFTNRIPWLEQTIWSFLAAKENTVSYFNKSQVIIAEKELKVSADTIAVHLVSTYRNHFSKLKAQCERSREVLTFAQIELENKRKFLNKFEFGLERIIKKTKRHLSIS